MSGAGVHGGEPGSPNTAVQGVNVRTPRDWLCERSCGSDELCHIIATNFHVESWLTALLFKLLGKTKCSIFSYFSSAALKAKHPFAFHRCNTTFAAVIILCDSDFFSLLPFAFYTRCFQILSFLSNSSSFSCKLKCWAYAQIASNSFCTSRNPSLTCKQHHTVGIFIFDNALLCLKKDNGTLQDGWEDCCTVTANEIVMWFELCQNPSVLCRLVQNKEINWTRTVLHSSPVKFFAFWILHCCIYHSGLS